jgi:Spy/CpxP family protein refolding chaperone
MRYQWKTGLAILALAIGSSMAMARTPQQGPPPDPDRFGGPDGHMGMGPGGPMGPGGGMGRDGSRGWRDGGDDRQGMEGREGRREHGGGMGMRGRGEEHPMGLAFLLNNPEIRQQIGVSAELAAKIRQQESDFRKIEIRNRADLQIKRLDLRDLLSADKPDRSAIDGKLQELSAAQLTMEKAAIYHRLDMREALTPAQRQKLEQWMKQRHESERGDGARERGPRDGGGRPGERGGRGGAPAPTSAPNAQPHQPPAQ